MADKFLKTLKLPGIDEPYKIPQTASDVGARPSSWMPTAADIGAAPAGYGLGEDVGRYCADCNTTKKSGFYYVNSNTSNVPDGIGGTLLVQSITATNGVDTYQTIKNGANVLQRYYSSYAGAWQPWEWINPPMNPGVEYRTTERWNGNPVYVQSFNVGAMPNTTTKRITVVTHSANIQVVDIWGVIKTAGNSQYDFNLAGADLYIEYTGSNPNLAIRTASDMSASTGIAYLKYTK